MSIRIRKMINNKNKMKKNIKMEEEKEEEENDKEVERRIIKEQSDQKSQTMTTITGVK